MKRCSRCSGEKPLTEFYADKRARDGRSSRCKACHCAAAKDYNTKNASAVRVRKAKYNDRNADHEAERKRAYNARHRDRDRESKKARLRRYRAENRLANQAHDLLQNARQRGEATAPDHCERCGKAGDLQGHHDDYTKPLDVAWICARCHGAEHRRIPRDA